MAIPDSALAEIEWIDPADAKHDDQPIDFTQVDFWVRQYKKGKGQYAPPILNHDMTIRDGRHRLLAMENCGITMARVIIVKEQD